MTSRRLSFLPLFMVLAACGDDGRATDDEGVTDDEIGTDDSSSESASETADGSSSSEDFDDSESDTDCSPCGNDCCSPEETCDQQLLECVLDCGGEQPCGDPAICCDGGELCYAGGCIVPGAPCEVGVCATDTETGCDVDEVCDGELGLCVPDITNANCTYVPEAGVFDPIPRFTWGVRKVRACMDASECQKEEVCNAGTCEVTWPHISPADDDNPSHHQAVSTPSVGDLDGDCIPEIVFNTYNAQNYTANGILRAIRGDTGEKVWSITDPAYRSDSGATPAIGDLDYDGVPEVVNPGEGTWLYAVAADGTILWKSDNYTGTGKSGSPSIVNMDLQGNAEIVYGRTVFDSNGALVWSGAGSLGNSGGVGQLACVADLDGDLRPEVIGGSTVYKFSGTVGVDFAGVALWTSGADGFCGIADFQLDGIPEVVLVRGGSIDILDGPTGALLSQFAIPGGGAGGPPNIADFDGDGLPDIGTAGGTAYVVTKFDGVATMTKLWEAVTKDVSSNRTGSSVFDFDGDGRSEVIYGDEWYLRIYPGTEPDCGLNPVGVGCDGIMTDAEVLFRDINSSRTRAEYPVIADVDGDFKAEIIVTTNNESSQGNIGDAGIEVFEDRLDNWVTTLPIWNQHTYHITNVDPKGGIPLVEDPNWAFPVSTPYNSYRRNTQGDVENCAPDLVLEDLDQIGMCTDEVTFKVRVCNQGCLGVGPGVDVTFSEADAGVLGTVATDKALPAGACITVQLTVPTPANPPLDVSASVDDDGMGMGALNECVEDNNAIGPKELCITIG
jgi:hypothetical protein